MDNRCCSVDEVLAEYLLLDFEQKTRVREFILCSQETECSQQHSGVYLEEVLRATV
jgi:hypothetical protein